MRDDSAGSDKWSSETMQEVVAGFSVDTSRQKSLAIIKEKLKQDKNTQEQGADRLAGALFLYEPSISTPFFCMYCFILSYSNET